MLPHRPAALTIRIKEKLLSWVLASFVPELITTVFKDFNLLDPTVLMFFTDRPEGFYDAPVRGSRRWRPPFGVPP